VVDPAEWSHPRGEGPNDDKQTENPNTMSTACNKRGSDLLHDPTLNKSTAFTEAERQAFGLVGLVPDKTETEDLQLSRILLQLGQRSFWT
jgi:hypothetical protein